MSNTQRTGVWMGKRIPDYNPDGLTRARKARRRGSPMTPLAGDSGLHRQYHSQSVAVGAGVTRGRRGRGSAGSASRRSS